MQVITVKDVKVGSVFQDDGYIDIIIGRPRGAVICISYKIKDRDPFIFDLPTKEYIEGVVEVICK